MPTDENRSGEIVISGKRNGEPVRYVSRITLDQEEAGNSFIPRLWARGHLDFLLSQGATPIIQNDVIALSEEFHIMTPYTSLLVLETDADRERFGVKRRFQMRDGERFFADGRSRASFELLQKQMQTAGNWRLELRRQVLSELALLGRSRRTNQYPQLFSSRELSSDSDFLSSVGTAARWEYSQEPTCLLYTSPSPRDKRQSRMPSSA